MATDTPIHLLSDSFYMKQTTESTAKLLEAGININTITTCIKSYTEQYIAIQANLPELLPEFTFEMWNNLNQQRVNQKRNR